MKTTHVCLAVLVAACASLASAQTPYDFVVSPRGDDAWSGKLYQPNGTRTDGPFATLDRARRAVRGLKAKEPWRMRPVSVLLRGGTYYLEETASFTAEDSGSEDVGVLYAAWPGETPVLSAGVEVKGMRVGLGGRWTTVLDGVKSGAWDFSQLFVDDARRFRPRLPAESYHFVNARVATPKGLKKKGAGDDRFRYRRGEIDPTWRNRDDVEVVTFHPWFTSFMRIESINEAKRLVVFTGRTRTSASFGEFKGGMRYLVDNVAEALSRPGQWYLDRPSGRLTYIPKPGETTAARVVAPRLERVVDITGARYITFRGITFAHTNWTVPKEGNSVVQAAQSMGAMAHLTDAHDITFESCTFTRGATYGVEIGKGSRRNVVQGCVFSDLGCGGVKIGTSRFERDESRVTSHNTVLDCTMAHLGRVHPAAVGVWIGHAHHNTIEHNEIYDLYYTAVSLGWRWHYTNSNAHHNVVRNNHMHTIGQGVLSDMGGIYTLGPSPGTVLSHNLIHTVRRMDYGGWGIYFDQGTSDILAENNVVYDTQDAGFNQHYGEGNTVRNNVFAEMHEKTIHTARLDAKARGPRGIAVYRFLRNIVYGWNGRSPVSGNWKGVKEHDKFEFADNVWYNDGKPVEFAGMSLAEWRKRGWDVNSVVADPKFVDAEKRDYALRPGSPALAMGFQPIDISGAGRLQKRAPDLDPLRWPRAFPPPPPPQPIGDDFESCDVGDKAPGAHTSEENAQATIRVTAGVAAKGKRSLKFTDGPGQKQSWNPHIYWRPKLKEGTVTERFHLRLERGAIVTHEWRTGGHPYQVGPSLHVGADGKLKANGKELLAMPREQWVALEIRCALGKKADGTYDLVVRGPGAARGTFRDLKCSDRFTTFGWLGFISGAQEKVVFYVDELELETK